MKTGNVSRKLWVSCVLVLMSFGFARPADAANVLTADRVGSVPPNSAVANVPVEKGKRPGLLLHFDCVDDTTLLNPTNACFPIQTAGATVVQVKIGAAAPLTCSTSPGAPGTCSYSVVDAFQNSNTCGPAANQPCRDTVKIVYNGDFPGFTAIQYSASGLQGVGGEFENLANQVTFNTRNNTPSTVSLELVLDISGSMDSPAVPGGTVKRMKALQDASQVLFLMLNSYALPGDKLGATFFTNSANPNATPTSAIPCSGMPATNLLGADTPTNITTIATAVAAQTPLFSTSLGAGLQSANCGFIREVAPLNVNRQILLFSDGEQNTAPNVQVVGGAVQVSDTAGANFSNFPANIRICPVTVGRLAAPGFALQQSIADAACATNNAHIRDADPANPNPVFQNPQAFLQPDLESFFVQSLTTAVTSDKVEVVVDTLGRVLRGQTVTEKFFGSANDMKMNIVLSWSGGGDGDRILPFQLKAPDGKIIDLTNRTTFARNMSFTELTFPLYQTNVKVAHGGEWQVLVNGTDIRGASMNYHLMVLADNPTIESEYSISVPDSGTGDPIPIRVKLSDNGVPLLNANVEVQLMGPANSQGNVLSNTSAPPASGTGPDPASTKGQTKLDAIYGDADNASLFADKSLPSLKLSDPAGTGIYTGSFTGTNKEGHYYFTVRVRGTSAVAGEIQRTFWLVRFVRSKPAPDKTSLRVLSSTNQANGSVLVRLQAIPHDRKGNFLGPGYEKAMRIRSSEGTVETPLDDKLDGSYEIVYRLPSAASNPSFNIEIMGAPLPANTLHELKRHRFAVFADAGVGIPQGTFGNNFKTGGSFSAGVEYMVTNQFSTEAVFGYQYFPANVGSTQNVYQFSANGKFYLPGSGSTRPFLNAGIGGYTLIPGTTSVGGNFGGGLVHEFSIHWGLRASYDFHTVSTSGAATNFSSIRAGVRYVF